MKDKFFLPVHPSLNIKSMNVFEQFLNTFKIILNRINNDKKKKLDEHGLEIDYGLSLDIKSLYIFATTFLNYMIRYIYDIFFRDINFDDGKGLKNNSFDSQVRQLRNNVYNGSNEVFKRYQEYILKYDGKIFFKIINIRDKFMSHIDLDIDESWLYIERTNKFYVLLSKKTEPYEHIAEDLRKGILLLGFKYSINKSTFSRQYGWEFFYFDELLEKIESLDKIYDNEDRKEIARYRRELGVSINEEEIIDIIFNFCEGLCDILGIREEFYILKDLKG